MNIDDMYSVFLPSGETLVLFVYKADAVECRNRCGGQSMVGLPAHELEMQEGAYVAKSRPPLPERRRFPHLCPVCIGYGSAARDTTDASIHPRVPCRACDGKGIVWG